MRRPARKPLDAQKRTDPRAVRAAAVAHLARRDFACAELVGKLESQAYDAAVIIAVVSELAQERLLDDSRFSANYVAYHATRGQGPARIAAKLKAVGLPCDLIDTALATIPDWQVRAQAVRVRKFGRKLPANWPEKSRQARFLQYRGFSSDHIRAALGADFNLDD